MKVNAGILLDLGNSETRMTLLSGGQTKDFILSNCFAEMPSKYVVPEKYKNDKSTIFCYNMVYYANGYIVDMEFRNEIIKPNALMGKTDQLTTKLSLNIAYIKALRELAMQYNVPVSELDVTFRVSVLLPPLEEDIHKDDMIALVKDIKSVTSLIPSDMTMKFEVSDVKVLPEGVASFFGVTFKEVNNNLDIAHENEDYQSGYSLVLDIGAGTTDMVLIKDGTLVQGSKTTLRKGGNTVESNLKSEIRKKYGFAPADMAPVVRTGILVDGNVEHDVSDLLTASKKYYSASMKNDIIDYIQDNMIEMREIKGILVVGGGSLATERDGKIVSPAMSEVLLEYLKELAPNLSIIDTLGLNPRLLNIIGLKYVHKYDNEN